LKAAIVRPQPSGGEGLGRVTQQDSLERVILVDDQDRPLGSGDKLDVHRAGELHRAFSVFVFSPTGDLLLQRRADGKYHFAGLWSNSCCGHPRPGEGTADAAVRRLGEELGFRTPLNEQVQLVYRADDPESGLIEHEYLHVFRGVFGGEPNPDPAEVSAWRWTPIAVLRRALAKSPELFTPWFRLIVERVVGAESADGSVIPAAGPAPGVTG
jgi:isopentenyl-diphosphate Delta-isomerase